MYIIPLSFTKVAQGFCQEPPVVEYPMNNHPLRFDAVAVETLLHHSILRVFALSLLTIQLLFSRAVVVWRGLVHVILSLVVSIHDSMVQLQLQAEQAQSVLSLIHHWLG